MRAAGVARGRREPALAEHAGPLASGSAGGRIASDPAASGEELQLETIATR